MEARIITDCQQWNDFVAQSKCCNITQSYEWGELAPHLNAAEALRIGVIDADGKLCAAMLTLVSRAPVLNRTYFYAPRGPVIDDPASPAMTVLLNFARAEARKRNAFMLKVEPSVLADDTEWQTALRRQGFRPNPYATHIRHEWVLDIRPDEKALLSGMKEKWRYNIRLAGRKGITVRQGESQADFDAFYRIYETTSERDRFSIHKKAHYNDILRMYSKGDRVALFLAEYEGKPIAGTIILRLGHWSWYMFGASSNEQRERMPNHLLQWTSMQWAKARGCWYYNFRGIPDILEEGQELWGVYVFKRGFGGYPMRALETHDLVYQPLLYEAYRKLLNIKRWRDERRFKRAAAAHP
ncbi:peptidoglycan bridge formation glycyltransferase FemA/FemB family protein [Ktedonosporobacter rubrisoli]|uniref:Peptidoglycan bridge formation glycyltransferase FemA/FemB family protein n=1 Tax=Ktedonosporobacter rubrisoli TaxID=2509675 RepID=A0A4P6JYW5_KTERU|nr:peptidoglycan bridge formation glycyltransferase FemA/FemB family protein [Ktedonosporobacter rubrisoli]QBD80914.1 peptidoglycan bridge formation glycyltransferase FemA/FemB family protein [Ktedonosporobacter rubrisoli]